MQSAGIQPSSSLGLNLCVLEGVGEAFNQKDKQENNPAIHRKRWKKKKKATVDLCAVGIINFFVQTASSQSCFNSSGPKPSVL